MTTAYYHIDEVLLSIAGTSVPVWHDWNLNFSMAAGLKLDFSLDVISRVGSESSLNLA